MGDTGTIKVKRLTKRIGFWWSDKKSQKLNTSEFKNILKSRGYELVKIDLDFPLESQGPFLAIVHKLSDIVAKADCNDPRAFKQVQAFEVRLGFLDKFYLIEFITALCEKKSRSCCPGSPGRGQNSNGSL